MIIFIDIDDTITNFAKILLKRLNQKYKTDYDLKDITYWDWITERYNEPWEVIDESFWKEVEVIAGAKKFVKERLEKNDEIYLVSATFIDNYLPIKIENTLKKLDNLLDKNHVIITNNKKLLCGDIMIDDGVHNLVENNCHLNFCFAQPWNWEVITAELKYKNIIRTNEWQRINDITNHYKSLCF